MNTKSQANFNFTDVVAELPSTVPFVSPETQERQRGQGFSARLGANENLFGPSVKAIEAIQKADTDLWKYGDEKSHALRNSLADFYNIPPECIVVGEGIDGLLGYLTRMFVTQGDQVVTSAGAYPTFNYHVTGYGGQIATVPYRDDYEDPRALIEKAAQTGAKLIYLANPDNPMGTVHSSDVITATIEAVPNGSLLVLDEAYIEFAPQSAQLNFDVDDPRVIRLRTFSKAYGLAGARVGYAIGHPDLIKAFDKVRNHFGMNRSAQIGAVAALHDQNHLKRVIANVDQGRVRLEQIATDNDLRAVPSATNFVAIDCGRDSLFAKSVLQGLIERNVFVRMPFVSPQDRCIRVAVGPDKYLDIFANALSDALKGAL